MVRFLPVWGILGDKFDVLACEKKNTGWPDRECSCARNKRRNIWEQRAQSVVVVRGSSEKIAVRWIKLWQSGVKFDR